jgi:plastocyanin
MKKFIGLCILVILLVAVSGCTQSAKPVTTTVPTTIITTVVPTTESTTVPPASIETTIVPAITEAATNVTTEIPTEVITAATPKVTNTPSTKITTIHIRNNTFVPQELTVLPGTGITWINDDKTAHALKTLPKSPFMFNSGDIMSGASYGYTYTAEEGSYGYFDTYTNATGLIIIKKGESVLGAPTMQTPAPTVTTT